MNGYASQGYSGQGYGYSGREYASQGIGFDAAVIDFNQAVRIRPDMGESYNPESYNPWSVAMFRTLRTVEPRSASEQAAYGKWLDQRTDRESARADRTHGAEGVIPTPLWLVLFGIGFPVIVSLVAGLYPASRAAKLDPVVAIRG